MKAVFWTVCFCEVVCGGGHLSGLLRGGRTFGGLGLQDNSDGSSVRNIFEYSCTEEGTGVGKGISKGGFKFSAFEARKNFDSTTSAYQREIREQLGGGF